MSDEQITNSPAPESSPAQTSNPEQSGALPSASQQSAPQNTPNYMTKDEYSESFRSVQSNLDKYGTQINQFGQTINALKPLTDLLTQQQRANQPDPLYQDPIGAVRELREWRAQQEQERQVDKQTITSLNNAVEEMKAQYIGEIKNKQIDHDHGSKFNSTDDLKRAKALALTTHNGYYAALYTANNGDASKAFGQYLELLKSGTLNDNNPQTQEVVNILNRPKQQQKCRER